MTEPEKYLLQAFEESRNQQQRFFDENRMALVAGAETLGVAIARGGKLLIVGSGASSIAAQYLERAMLGRSEMRPLPAISLSTILLGDDVDQAFERQLRALAQPNDVVLALAENGNAASVLRAAGVAKALGCPLITLTAGTGGKLQELGDIRMNTILAKSSDRVQEAFLFALHSLVDVLERFFLK